MLSETPDTDARATEGLLTILDNTHSSLSNSFSMSVIQQSNTDLLSNVEVLESETRLTDAL